MKILSQLKKKENILPYVICSLFISLIFAVKTLPVSGAEGSYILSAKTITVNQNYTDTLTDSSDRNYYKFSLETPGEVSISFSHELFSDEGAAWEISLYNESREEVRSMFSSDGYTPNKTGIGIGLPAGTYYVKVGYNYYSLALYRSYTLNVNFIPSNAWETEFNDDWLTADPIAVNSSYSGSLLDSYDDDYYTFTLDHAGVVSIEFSHEIYSGSHEAWWIGLYTDSHDKIYSMISSDGYTQSRTGIPIGLPSGRYYILVNYSYSAALSYPYEFKINYSASDLWETEFNDDWLTADPIAVNSSYSGSLYDSSDDDYYTFSLNTSASVWISFSHEKFAAQYSCWWIGLYDSSRQKIYSMDSSDGYTKTKNSAKFKLSAGQYYVMVDDNYSSALEYPYSFTVHTEVEQTPKAPGKLKINQPKNQAKKSLKVSWKKSSTANGYEVQIALNKKFTKGKKSKLIKNAKTTSAKFTGLKRKKTYYVRARAFVYQNNGKKLYGKWSDIKKIKIKNA